MTAAGFFYSRYDDRRAGDQLKQANYFQKLYFHKLGTPQSKDELIYERKDHKDWNFSGEVTEDGALPHHRCFPGNGSEKSRLLQGLTNPTAKVVELLNKQDAAYNFVGNEGNAFWFRTNLNAPKAASSRSMSRTGEINDMVPEAADKLESVIAGRRSFRRELSQGRAFCR